MYFSEVLATFHRAIEPRTYVQLGLDHPSLLSLAQCGSVAVAPAPRVVSGVHAGKPWLKVFDLPRDQFFAGEDRSATLEGDPLDLVVIDGGSLTQIASDLDGLVAWSHPGTVVLVLPPGDDREGLSLLAHAASDLLPHGVLRFVAAEPSPMLMLARFDAAGRNRPRFAEAIQAGPQQAARSQGIAPVSVEQAIEALGRRPLPISTRLVSGDWVPRAANRRRLEPRLLSPAGDAGPTIVLDPSIRHAFRVRISLSLAATEALRVSFRSVPADGGLHERNVWVDVARPGALEHELACVKLHTNPALSFFELECEGELRPGETLTAIALTPVGADLGEIPPQSGMAIEVLSSAAEQLFTISRATRFVPARFADRSSRPHQHLRDAVVFAWYVPEEFPQLGEYYLGLLRYHHADSKLFIGMNHGSDPRWDAEFRRSGLDVCVQWARPEIEDYWDTTGFLTALSGYHRNMESFALVWFGHTKGGSVPDSDVYRSQRFNHHRAFWARRDDVARAFRDPAIGLFAPRFNLTPPFPWPGAMNGWDGELAALRRVFRDRCQPLGLCAYETVFTFRDEIVRRFCNAVGEPFFGTDPGQIGANKWFFEMAFPSIASMQGYEPFVDMNVAGAGAARDDVTLFDDPKQNHRLARDEVERWRRDPYRFQPRIIPWDHPAWDEFRGLAVASSTAP